MPELVLQFTKRKNGGALLRCIRADGSSTWQRHAGNRAAFFPLHDLTHYAVETELGFVRGFTLLLKAHGVATFEFPHLLRMLSENQFDTAGRCRTRQSRLNMLLARWARNALGTRPARPKSLTTSPQRSPKPGDGPSHDR